MPKLSRPTRKSRFKVTILLYSPFKWFILTAPGEQELMAEDLSLLKRKHTFEVRLGRVRECVGK